MYKKIFILIMILVMSTTILVAQESKKLEKGIFLQQDTISIKEPLKAIFEWKNNGSQEVYLSIPYSEFYIYVAYEDDKFNRYQLFYPSIMDIKEGIDLRWEISEKISPHKVYRRIRWICLGRKNLKGPWEFIFNKEGTYKISLSPKSKNYKILKVKRLKSPIDKKAEKDFNKRLAGIFLGESLVKKEILRKAQKFIKKYPESLYSPYISLGLAKLEWENNPGSRLNFSKYSKYLKFIIEKHSSNKLLLEEALFLLIRGLSYKKEKKGEIKKYFQRLKEEFPQSEYLDYLNKYYYLDIE